MGSSAGITRDAAGKTDFGATDVPASAKDLTGASDGSTVQVPVDLGAVDVAYNVPVLNGQPLKLTGPVLARIFLGQITRWDDPAITALNPSADLPRTYITVVHRSDGSGTTTSSATTCPRSAQRGPPRSAPAGPCTGRPATAGR